MSEFKGTKGKWRIENTSSNLIIDKSDAFSVTSGNYYSLNWSICAVWKDCNTLEESEANAKLISCAPEMLEMLEELYNDKETFSNLFASQQFKIIQLIKKATS